MFFFFFLKSFFCLLVGCLHSQTDIYIYIYIFLYAIFTKFILHNIYKKESEICEIFSSTEMQSVIIILLGKLKETKTLFFQILKRKSHTRDQFSFFLSQEKKSIKKWPSTRYKIFHPDFCHFNSIKKGACGSEAKYFAKNC